MDIPPGESDILPHSEARPTSLLHKDSTTVIMVDLYVNRPVNL